MKKHKPIVTRTASVGAVCTFALLSPWSQSSQTLALLLLVCCLAPPIGMYVDWLRIEKPRNRHTGFALAIIVGTLALGFTPNIVSMLWHPVLLAVVLFSCLRGCIVTGTIVARSDQALVVAMDKGHLVVSREAHPLLGARTPLQLEPGAPLALATRVSETSTGPGPFRRASSLSHEAIVDVAPRFRALLSQRLRRASIATALVLASAFLGWLAVLVHFTTLAPCHLAGG